MMRFVLFFLKRTHLKKSDQINISISVATHGHLISLYKDMKDRDKEKEGSLVRCKEPAMETKAAVKIVKNMKINKG